jgi:hypothetical protein
MDPEIDTEQAGTDTTTEGEELEAGEGDGAEGGEAGATGAGEGEQGSEEGGDVVISLAGEEVQPEEDENAAPTWVRDLRKSNREKDRALRERDAEIARLKGAPAAPAAIVVGEEPTFEGCEYDPDKFKVAFTAWSKRKNEADAQERTRNQVREQEQAQWTTRLKAVDTATAKLGVKDAEDATNAFEGTFSVVQRGIILGALEDPKNSAAMRYALGMNPKRAKELAAIADPIKFAVAIGKLEDKLTIAPRKTAPLPETRLRGSAPMSGAIDSTLERLQKEAEKTSDRSKVAAHIRAKNKAAQAA